MSSKNKKYEKKSEKHSSSHKSSRRHHHEYSESHGEQESHTPRHQPIEDLADEVGGLTLDEAPAWESSSRSYSHDQHLKKGKGKAVQHVGDESDLGNVHLEDYGGGGGYTANYGTYSSTEPLDTGSGGTNLAPIDEMQASSNYSSSMPTNSGIGLETDDYDDGTGTAYMSSMTSRTNKYPDESYLDDDENDPELAEAVKQSTNAYYGNQLEGEASGSTAHNYYHSVEEFDEGGAAGMNAPSGTGPKKKMRPSYSSNDQFTWPDDDRFGVCPTSSYQPGQVFKVVWAEPKGAAGKRKEPLESTPGYPYTEKGKKKGENSKQFYTGVRRFIVTATEVGSSICVPILTYEGRACTKKGVKAGNHGIVYAPPEPPTRLPGEPDHGFEPIRMHLYAEGETLVRESRVNYSKLVTIEHNINVLFIGEIYPDDIGYVSMAVDDCWNRRIREPKRDHRKKHR